MPPESARKLRTRLRELGLSRAAISAAWPSWWSSDADRSASARAELRFSIARRLGLDPRSLVDPGNELLFLWRGEARFKHLAGEDERELAAITSFGRAVAALLIRATPMDDVRVLPVPGQDLRRQILEAGQPFVGLGDLLAVAWSVGIPVIHLRVFPLPQKRMAAMTVRLGDRWAVLLGKDATYPAPIAFYLGHELGHVALDHVGAGQLIVDIDQSQPSLASDDAEESEADAYALELLTGESRLTVLAAGNVRAPARELARTALSEASELGIEPGMLAQCYGYSTGDWAVVNAALSRIYASPRPVWADVNRVARAQLRLSELPDDAAEFLDSVLGTDPTRA